MFASFSETIAFPLQFYKDREELNQVYSHLQEPNDQLKDPQMLKPISDHFAKLCGAWLLGPEESLEFEIPVTHGMRLKSNSPAVSLALLVS